jgi:hypothetical protein
VVSVRGLYHRPRRRTGPTWLTSSSGTGGQGAWPRAPCVGGNVGDGGSAAAAVDGVGDAKVHGAHERHPFHVAEQVVVE